MEVLKARQVNNHRKGSYSFGGGGDPYDRHFFGVPPKESIVDGHFLFCWAIPGIDNLITKMDGY